MMGGAMKKSTRRMGERISRQPVASLMFLPSRTLELLRNQRMVLQALSNKESKILSDRIDAP
jgi:hypothetical protein